MNKNFKKILKNSLFVFPTIFFGMFAFQVFAQGEISENTVYPIVELGNCENKNACAIYCDNSENMSSCVDFSVKQGLISDGEAVIAKKAIVKIKSGQTPGGCKDKESCQTYCQNNIASLNSCIAFAEELGVQESEITQAKKIALALSKGANLPGGCQGKMACEAYCKDTNNIDECLVFAEAAEILPVNELAEAKKVAKYIKSGETPGQCKTKDECKLYCDQDSNFEECLGFAEKAQLVSKEEIDMAKKTGGKGPGGCKSKDTCETYCNNPDNAKQCADFAIEKNLLSEEEMDNIKNGIEKIKTGLDQVPAEIKPDVEICLNNLFGGNLQGVLAGKQTLTKAQGDKVGACFESAAKKYAEQQMNQGVSGGAGGSGGQSNNSQQGPPAGSLDSLKNAPVEIQNQVQQEIEKKKQEMQNKAQEMIPTNIPLSVPSVGNQGSMPTNIPLSAPPAGIQGNIPTNIPSSVPSVGAQGPPCNSPEECAAMFGGGGPPAGIPR